MKTIACACCLRKKYREVDPVRYPGRYFRALLRGWCSCVEDSSGVILKVGLEARS